MQTVENVVIAAAGMGRRLGLGIPKSLVEINGKKLLEYQLDVLKDVKNVYMIVGFCDTDVINAVVAIRPDVVFVRNPNYKHTNTLQSFYLASQIIDGDAVFMDGDMILSKKDFNAFLENCHPGETRVAVSTRISNDPVYAVVEKEKVCEFTSLETSDYEWANIMYINATKIKDSKENVYDYLGQYLPTRVSFIDRLEIDTLDDLEIAKKEVSSLIG